MELIIKGNTHTVPSTVQTVSLLLEHLNIKHESAIVEQNTEILDKKTYTQQAISDGDRLEIVHFVGGG